MNYNYIKLLQDHNIEYDDSEAWHRGFITVPCPFCMSSSRYGGINYRKNYFKCWKCGFRKIDEYVETAIGENWFSIRKDYLLDEELFREPEQTHVEKLDLPKEAGPLNDWAREYLLHRGFDPDELIRDYKILSTNHLGKYKFRIIIPIYFKNKLVSFTSRDYTGNAEPRYKSCSKKLEVINHKDILYGYDQALDDWCIAVEGPLDKWKMGRNALATFGTSYNQNQASLFLRYNKIAILFDNEPEAQNLAAKLANTLICSGKQVKNFIIKDKDPGSLNFSEAEYLIKKIKSYWKK